MVQSKGKFEEPKALYLIALEDRNRVLGAEHKKTLGTLNNLGTHLQDIEDYEGALDYHQQALSGCVKVKVLGKTHPDTLKSV